MLIVRELRPGRQPGESGEGLSCFVKMQSGPLRRYLTCGSCASVRRLELRVETSLSPDVLYVAASNMIDTVPEKTLLAFAGHGKLAGILPRDGGDCEAGLDNFRKVGIDLEQLAAVLRSQGAKSFDESWRNLLEAIKSKGKQLQCAC